MDNTAKLNRLRKISQEANLRELLMNLFERMTWDPVLTHGTNERGKDIVCKETKNVLHVTEWIGCVVKQGKITGATSGNSSIQTIVNQVQEAFIHPYTDTGTKQKIFLNKVYVINNDEILATAK